MHHPQAFSPQNSLPEAPVGENYVLISGRSVFVEPSDAVPAKMGSRGCHLSGDLEKSVRTQFSIIVPVFNEATLIRPFLQHLRERAPEAEVVVADGGSTDGTDRLAAGFCDQLVRSERNRGVQMNAGACVACGDILWFVHVDAEVPSRCLDEIARS